MSAIIRGETRTVAGPGGTSIELSDEFPSLPLAELSAAADRIQAEMTRPHPPAGDG